ncbi:MAG: DNA-processing protein DprA, partial [Flavobacteriales bacterium]|nr:DNA-processing protein DprA [Flavobacteriales bacterium]
MERQEQTLYLIALTKIPGVGDVVAKKLIAYCGGVKEVFSQSRSALKQIPSIGNVLASAVHGSSVLKEAEKELSFTDKHGVQVISFLDKSYPDRLKHCVDSPIVLYTKGPADLNPIHSISIVGTRNATRQGKELTEKMVEELGATNITIISGLAYGIDVAAHKAALKFSTPTIGCLAHGLDRMYPKVHAKVAKEILENGALVTDFPIGTNPDRENFPKRNRIVAGLSDATIV